MFNLKTGVGALLALALAQSATGALARTPDASSADTVQVVVRYGDLNLATPEGAQALRARVDRAAVLIKGDVDPRDLKAMSELHKARATALETANTIIAAHANTAYAATRPAPNWLAL